MRYTDRIKAVKTKLQTKKSLVAGRSVHANRIRALFVPQGGKSLESLLRLCEYLENKSNQTKITTVQKKGVQATRQAMDDLLTLMEDRASLYARPRRIGRFIGQTACRRGPGGDWDTMTKVLIALDLGPAFYEEWMKILCQVHNPDLVCVGPNPPLLSQGGADPVQKHWLQNADTDELSDIHDRFLIRGRGAEVIESAMGVSAEIQEQWFELASDSIEDTSNLGDEIVLWSAEDSIIQLYRHCKADPAHADKLANGEAFLAFLREHSPNKTKILVGYAARLQPNPQQVSFDDGKNEPFLIRAAVKVGCALAETVYASVFSDPASVRCQELSRLMGYETTKAIEEKSIPRVSKTLQAGGRTVVRSFVQGCVSMGSMIYNAAETRYETQRTEEQKRSAALRRKKEEGRGSSAATKVSSPERRLIEMAKEEQGGGPSGWRTLAVAGAAIIHKGARMQLAQKSDGTTLDECLPVVCKSFRVLFDDCIEGYTLNLADRQWLKVHLSDSLACIDAILSGDRYSSDEKDKIRYDLCACVAEEVLNKSHLRDSVVRMHAQPSSLRAKWGYRTTSERVVASFLERHGLQDNYQVSEEATLKRQ